MLETLKETFKYPSDGYSIYQEILPFSGVQMNAQYCGAISLRRLGYMSLSSTDIKHALKSLISAVQWLKREQKCQVVVQILMRSASSPEILFCQA